MMNEAQIVQALAGLLVAVVTALVSAAVPKLKAWMNNHLSAQQATVANDVLTGLASITQSVVQNFTQTVVNDAKTTGTWTPELMAQVKADAVKAVQSQGSTLVTLGNKVIGDVPALIGTLVEQAVAQQKSVQAKA
jgi:hypothetical protein